MTRSSQRSLILGACFAVACSGSGSGDGGTDGSTGGGGSTSAGSASSTSAGTSSSGTSAGTASGGGTTSGTSAGTATGGGSTGGSTSAGSTGAGSTGAGSTGGGGECGGAACEPTQWCDWTDDGCGKTAGGEGQCEPRPPNCPDIYSPVCGCDGKVYSNPCDAQAVGVDANLQGGCEPPPGMFGCGAFFCLADSQYCERDVSDLGGVPDTYACVDAFDACGNGKISCTCLSKVPCGDMCEMTGAGYTVTCPGG